MPRERSSRFRISTSTAVRAIVFPRFPSAASGRDRIDRMRARDAEALGVAHAERLDPHQHVLLFDAFGDHLDADCLPDPHDRLELAVAWLALEDLADDRAVDLDEIDAQRLQWREGHRAAAEAVDHHAAA